jgi:D-serine dehydratase
MLGEVLLESLCLFSNGCKTNRNGESIVPSKILGKRFDEWKQDYPLLEQLMAMEEVFWVNPLYESCCDRVITPLLGDRDIDDAEQRLARFAPYIARAFPETQSSRGIIESPLMKISSMQQQIEGFYHQEMAGNLYLKCDSHLPISGSIKARGGIYEILKVAEDIAIKQKMLAQCDDYSILDSEKFRNLFAQYTIIVGSTGNLGLSIGIMSAVLGFNVTVHMSADAKQWKKDMLRAKGVTVIEHQSDYSKAVAAGRKQAQQDPHSHFVDDENSQHLFLGYAVAAKRLKKQLDELAILVDKDHPMFVYLPCGVGGGPGGVTFGLKTVYKDYVHCFFCEPTHSPAMLIGLMTGLHNKVSVQDFSIDNVTDADGLAVGRPSGFVGKTLEKDISGVVTVQDKQLYHWLRMLADSEKICLEPSALAGFAGVIKLFTESAGKKYLEQGRLLSRIKNATHIVWATGGSMVPKDMMDYFYNKCEFLK